MNEKRPLATYWPPIESFLGADGAARLREAVKKEGPLSDTMSGLDIPSLSFDYGKIIAPTEKELREGFRFHLLSRAKDDVERAEELEAEAKKKTELAGRYRERAKALGKHARGYE